GEVREGEVREGEVREVEVEDESVVGMEGDGRVEKMQGREGMVGRGRRKEVM
ncbi:unnamed protein product, partial [Closterium sp. NIES-53]